MSLNIKIDDTELRTVFVDSLLQAVLAIGDDLELEVGFDSNGRPTYDPKEITAARSTFVPARDLKELLDTWEVARRDYAYGQHQHENEQCAGALIRIIERYERATDNDS